MAYYEDEVPKELEIGKQYTSREIYLYMIENRNVMILSDSVHLDYNGGLKYEIVDIKENFIHKQADTGYRVHQIPNSKTKILEIRRV
ncbi:hypothetical protein PUS82_15345 [Cytobacillus firmus]|uniref:hypothetical protein n=1 Tax=Cytobacillus firmus TaxID=1399 RepID=UPI00237B1871|nr:hypothetical protein [Cytobacillus firmus]MDD9312649.1 hypothetical protein [Cytobacillus firmus]